QAAVSLTDVQEIEILSREPPHAEPLPMLIEVEEAGRAHAPISEQELSQLAVAVTQPKKNMGWALRDVVGLRVPVEEIAAVTLHYRDGDPARIAGKELQDAAQMFVVKQNETGDLVVRHALAG